MKKLFELLTVENARCGIVELNIPDNKSTYSSMRFSLCPLYGGINVDIDGIKDPKDFLETMFNRRWLNKFALLKGKYDLTRDTVYIEIERTAHEINIAVMLNDTAICTAKADRGEWKEEA